MVRVLVLAATGLASITATACAGGGAATFSSGDLPKIVGGPPRVPKGISYYEDRQDPSAFTLDELRQRSEMEWKSDDLKELRDANFKGGYGKWWHSDGDVSAEARAFLLGDASRTAAVLAVLRRRVVQADAQNDGYTLARIPPVGLGADSWGFHSDDLFIYGWRQNNVVVEADMYCGKGTCEAAVGRAARAYAEAIDARMKRD